MASSQSPTRPVAVTAGIGLAALLAAAAAALPAAADSHGNSDHNSASHGNSESAPGHNKSSGDQSSASQSSTTSDDPPGNNGTVFIHDVAGDEHPHNVPHVSCNFWVDFFGFDNSQQVTVSFAGQAPTGKDTPLGGTTTTTLQADSASGAGNDWDGELAFTADELGVSNLGDPAHEGYHVKMTVVTNQPGDHKYKVFWIQPCEAATTSTQSTAAGGESAGAPTSTSTNAPGSASTNASNSAPTQSGTTQNGQSTSGAIVAMHATRTTAQIPTEVLGTKFTRGGNSAPAAAATASSLPFTGAEIGAMALAAALALGGGVLLMVAGRRRRNRVSSH